MAQYELIYWPMKGRAEIIRVTLAAAGLDFKDTRYTFEEWPSYKDSIPFKAIPALVIDGTTVLGQSMAIIRYLGRLYGFYGKTADEEYIIDEVIECLMHVLDALIQLHVNPESLKRKVTERYNEVCERVLEYVESKLKPGQLHIVGNSLSLADIACYVILETAVQEDVNLLKNYPNLANLREDVAKRPSIAAYLERRPKCRF
ncbi:glutathione S-transferase-like isoform X1 [Octopus sinensis]|uniref:glutathione transferase n=1 Tax=Octopus sinensis TaxID=2607531 RepID=A0A7E6EVC5_9MOLL|nr:glutathione S-transferase-like isoform X1 [Octopus sinensis]